MSGQNIIIKQLRAEVERLRERAEKAEANYAFMVERAADQKLDGYRELGARAAAAEDRAEKAEREFADRLDHLTAAVKRGDVLQARVTELEKRLAASRAIVDDLKSTIRREEVRGDTAIRERDEARAERDARPDISAEDAELFSRTSHTVSQTIEDRIPGYADAMSRIASALQGHAEKAVKS